MLFPLATWIVGYHCSFFLDPLQSLSSKRNSRCPLYLFPPLPLVPLSLHSSPRHNITPPLPSQTSPLLLLVVWPLGLLVTSISWLGPVSSHLFFFKFFLIENLVQFPNSASMCVVLLTQRSSSCLTLPSQVPPTHL